MDARRRAVAFAWLAVGAGLAAAGCGSPRPNLLVNGGFEQGSTGWQAAAGAQDWVPFEVSHAHALTGNASLRTHLTGKPTNSSSLVAGAYQEIDLDRAGPLPAHLTGAYYVDAWSSSAPKTYLQVVVMAYALNGTTVPICNGIPNKYSCQVAFVLGGVSERPINIGNRRFVFLATPVPATGRWVHFDAPVASAFADAWGAKAPPLRWVRVYLEARYEEPADHVTPAVDVDAYWDDVRLA